MQKWVEVLNEIEQVSSTKQKKDLLVVGINAYPDLETFLKLTFKSNSVLNIDSKTIENALGIDTKQQFKDIGDKIHWYINNNASNKSLLNIDNKKNKSFEDFIELYNKLTENRGMFVKQLLNDFFLNCDDNDAKWYARCIVKDLSSKVSIKTINKALICCDRKPITKFSMQLALPLGNTEIESKIEKLLVDNNNELYCENKEDGVRGCVTNLNGKWEMLSRNGKPILNINNILYEAERIFGDTPTELDGELIAEDFYSLSSTIHRKNDTTTIIPRTFQIFDIMTYKDNIEHLPYKERRNILCDIIPKDSLLFKVVEAHTCYSVKSILDYFDKQVENGEEGIIIKTNTPYTRKRENWYKIKPVHTLDLRIIGFEYEKYLSIRTMDVGYENDIRVIKDIETNKKFEPRRNVLIVSDLNGKLISKVGSGLKEDDIELFSMGEESEWIGKIVEVKFDSITPINKKGVKSLRFPRFVRLRDDKDVADIV